MDSDGNVAAGSKIDARKIGLITQPATHLAWLTAVARGGCSIHPLQQEATGLRTTDLVNCPL
jgi:hypothetical protein